MIQLDFLSGYQHLSDKESADSQMVLWDTAFKPTKVTKAAPEYSEIEMFFLGMDYTKVSTYRDYWKSITPQDDSEIFKRWLFAFMSVHTSWKMNVAGYNNIKDWWKWINKWSELLEKIQNSGVGMHNLRVKFISEFAYKFWENPSNYKKKNGEAWSAFRNRLKEVTMGLGPAKTSFALELCYPNEAKITCLDTHMFQAYKLDQTKHAQQYERLEDHWVDMCSMWNISPYIARCIYWDKKQGHTDSRYWSNVFE
jgi:thermostable 8-oxoguanine DNA glycosylase